MARRKTLPHTPHIQTVYRAPGLPLPHTRIPASLGRRFFSTPAEVGHMRVLPHDQGHTYPVTPKGVEIALDRRQSHCFLGYTGASDTFLARGLSSNLHYLQQQSAGLTCDKRGNKEFTQPRKEWETRGPGVEAVFPSGIFLSSDHFVCSASTLFEVHT
jgi:hypothetical protein